MSPHRPLRSCSLRFSLPRRHAGAAAGLLAGLAIALGWAATPWTPLVPDHAPRSAWVAEANGPLSCKPRPPFEVGSSVDALGNWQIRVTNPGQPRDLVVTTWSDVTPAPVVVWTGRLRANEARTFDAGAPPVAAGHLWAAVELQLPDPSAGRIASDAADGGPIVWRNVVALRRETTSGAAAAGPPEPQPHIDPGTGERVLDLPGTLGTAP